ncbi:uncharacterized protein LOC106672655 [Cimex lectularius]|uniref:lysozyme n=1 Tax=Cimex lectularius TaxID=79782 RepID=A0A8I6SVP8_CIMLE|nr:uncharacterized protein LOC106672655 [Cimex lectularius]
MISRVCVSIFVIAVGVTLIYGQQGFLNVKPVNELCLGCICEAISNCNTSLGCSGNICGLFKITWAYWADANKPTLKLDNPDSNDGKFLRHFFFNLYNLKYQRYQGRLNKTQENPKDAIQRCDQKIIFQDCNNDGVVDCFDYAAIHMLGGYGCRGNLNPDFNYKFNTCQQQVAQIVSGTGGNAN